MFTKLLDHGEILVIVASLILGTVAAVLRNRDPEDWAKLQKASPRYAALISMCRGLGIDTPTVLRALLTLLTGQIAHLTPPSAESPPPAHPPQDSLHG